MYSRRWDALWYAVLLANAPMDEPDPYIDVACAA